ncbi:hypothetical protein ACHAXT_012128, partial [Thalassiosira profunda]
LSDSEGQLCDNFDLGICQRAVCENNTCVFDTDQVGTDCLCGVCVDNCTDLDQCAGNCQYSGVDGARPSALIVYAPCQYDYLTVEIDNAGLFNLTRSPEGFFNISVDSVPGGGSNGLLGSKLWFYGYGDPEFNSSVTYPGGSTNEYADGEWRWEIHTSCSFELRLNQTFGPQNDLIIAGFCLSDNKLVNKDEPCGYLDEVDPYQCSAAPSSQPSTSVKPSHQPSSEPTGMPSENPSTSRQPSGEPSGHPSLHPSALPSSEPTEGTNEPSLQPSDAPSTPPSEEPSSQPSGEPTLEPSREPSGTPSTEPTFLPSARPSSIPSISSAPISDATSEPSGEPSQSSIPSSTPTTPRPTSSPSDQPSLAPSESPSDGPSLNPSSGPTLFPSESPSDWPSLNPSSGPTLFPSESPSLTPTGSPTTSPTDRPSPKPSTAPSSVPTDVPSLEPSETPSETPTGAPTLPCGTPGPALLTEDFEGAPLIGIGSGGTNTWARDDGDNLAACDVTDPGNYPNDNSFGLLAGLKNKGVGNAANSQTNYTISSGAITGATSMTFQYSLPGTGPTSGSNNAYTFQVLVDDGSTVTVYNYPTETQATCVNQCIFIPEGADVTFVCESTSQGNNEYWCGIDNILFFGAARRKLVSEEDDAKEPASTSEEVVPEQPPPKPPATTFQTRLAERREKREKRRRDREYNFRAAARPPMCTEKAIKDSHYQDGQLCPSDDSSPDKFNCCEHSGEHSCETCATCTGRGQLLQGLDEMGRSCDNSYLAEDTTVKCRTDDNVVRGHMCCKTTIRKGMDRPQDYFCFMDKGSPEGNLAFCLGLGDNPPEILALQPVPEPPKPSLRGRAGQALHYEAPGALAMLSILLASILCFYWYKKAIRNAALRAEVARMANFKDELQGDIPPTIGASFDDPPLD